MAVIPAKIRMQFVGFVFVPPRKIDCVLCVDVNKIEFTQVAYYT